MIFPCCFVRHCYGHSKAEPTTEQVTSYRALMIAGPSEKGKELAAKVNAGEALTWEDVSSANWSVVNSSSPAGYIYPCLLYTSRPPPLPTRRMSIRSKRPLRR